MLTAVSRFCQKEDGLCSVAPIVIKINSLRECDVSTVEPGVNYLV